ncbi:MAG: L-threonylcarbamoyladenylate synthase [Pseudomonadota bacterium]
MTTFSTDIDAAVKILRDGGVVAFPTETVYGLGADALNAHAVARLFAIKGRPAQHPVIVHLPGVEHLPRWAREIPAAAYDLARRFWPGPLTIILKRAAGVPDAVTGGQDTVGVRVPGHPVALELLRRFDGGIAAPSANRFGHLSPTRAGHVHAELGDAVDLILEGGPSRVGLESTIISLAGERPAILRPGCISRAVLQEALHQTVSPHAAQEESAPRAPGTLEAHYAPRTPLRLVSADAIHDAAMALLSCGHRVGVLGPVAQKRKWPVHVNLHKYPMPNTPEEYARDLYATLHQADDDELDYLLVQEAPQDEEWLAVRDRLQRAAHTHKE